MKSNFTNSVAISAFLSVFLFLFSAGEILAQENGEETGMLDSIPVNTNGGFEDSDPGIIEDLESIPGWVLELGGSAEADFEIVEDPVQEGGKALEIAVKTLGSSAWHIQVVGDSIPVEPGAKYEMSVWMMANDAGSVDVTVGNYDFSEYGRSSETLAIGEWQEYVLEFTVTDDETVIRAPVHFNFDNNLDNTIYLDNLQIVEIEEAPARRSPVVVEAVTGDAGSDFNTDYEVIDEDTTHFVYVTTDAWDEEVENWDRPEKEERVIAYEVTFPYAGEYNLFMRGRVGPEGADDDSFLYPVGFGERDVSDPEEWITANQLEFGGYTNPDDFVVDAGTGGEQVWKWMNISEGNFHEDGITYTVEEDSTTVSFLIGGRETDFEMHKLAFGRADLFFTVDALDNAEPGVYEIPEDPVPEPEGPPLAEDLSKFLGNIYSNSQIEDFEHYWNQVTPENASKWGSVEGTRDQMNWSGLDNAYDLARDNGWPFRFHVLVWGNQQPSWMAELSENPEEQLQEIEEWFNAVANRYPDIDYLEVVNEPLHDPPNEEPDNTTSGNYIGALGGTGETGWDWVITAFEMARDIFPEDTRLMINDYGILNSSSNAEDYVELIELLQERDLIDGIGVQGHAFSTRGMADDMTNVLDILAETGLPIQVTEMDVDGNPTQSPNVTREQSDQNQLEAMQRIFPALWEHPAVEGITMWGWRPGLWRDGYEAHLVRSDKEERPAIQWLRDYLDAYETSAAEFAETSPQKYQLSNNYPNPFNPSTQISYRISEASDVTLKVYDITGRHIQTLVNSTAQSPGHYTVMFEAVDLASGVYLYRLQAGSYTDVKRMMLVK